MGLFILRPFSTPSPTLLSPTIWNFDTCGDLQWNGSVWVSQYGGGGDAYANGPALAAYANAGSMNFTVHWDIPTLNTSIRAFAYSAGGYNLQILNDLPYSNYYIEFIPDGLTDYVYSIPLVYDPQDPSPFVQGFGIYFNYADNVSRYTEINKLEML